MVVLRYETKLSASLSTVRDNEIVKRGPEFNLINWRLKFRSSGSVTLCFRITCYCKLEGNTII